MSGLKIDRYKWIHYFDETWITFKNRESVFIIILKQEGDVEIIHDWDYENGERGCERMNVPVKLLRELLDELGV